MKLKDPKTKQNTKSKPPSWYFLTSGSVEERGRDRQGFH